MPVPPKEVSAGSRTFAQTLREAALGEDPAIAAFGVQLPRQATIDPTAKLRPIAMPEAPEDSLGPLGGVVPPSPAPDLPIDTLHIETRDPHSARWPSSSFQTWRRGLLYRSPGQAGYSDPPVQPARESRRPNRRRSVAGN